MITTRSTSVRQDSFMSKTKHFLFGNKKRSYLILVHIIVLSLVSYFSYGYIESYFSPEASNKRVLNHISNFMVLPEDEEPVIANVVDKEKLGNQEFFDLAENKDILFFYPKAKKAILYRPSINKVVEVAQINLESN